MFYRLLGFLGEQRLTLNIKQMNKGLRRSLFFSEKTMEAAY